ncbi:GNAT family N-acetyltransferase [Desertivirga arenae]|uniref:GNAT family N-acetyltransferase n=1 Tax=Desertivirga arenae TaxID=2810309 RepID=UPI001A96CB84|nr:GNAT family N-acetyltransferase [Pedobacter sp. SYSU D00823]
MNTSIIGYQGVSLRTLTEAMADALSREANDSQIGKYLRDIFPYPYTPEHAQSFIELQRNNKALCCLAIFSGENFAGIISFTFQEDIYRHSAEIGFWLGKRFQGRGIMTEAVRLGSEYAFRDLNIIRLFAAVFEPNIASKQVLVKNGFQMEGKRRKAVIKNKEFVNDYLFAKLKDDE